jgi:hypothetical protein
VIALSLLKIKSLATKHAKPISEVDFAAQQFHINKVRGRMQAEACNPHFFRYNLQDARIEMHYCRILI